MRRSSTLLRRRFLQSALGAAVVPQVLARDALGGERPAPSRRVALGFIGLGWKGFETGCRPVTVCHLGNIAYQLQRPLKWDPDREAFLGDGEANRLLSRAHREPWGL